MTNAPTPEHPRKFRRRADARPDEVLDAALTVFMREGFEAARVEDIAKIAGISKATVYLYFPSKVTLLEGLVKRSISPVAIMVEKMLEQFKGTAKEAIALVLELVSSRMLDPKVYGVPVIVMREANRFPDLAKIYHDEVLSHVLPALRSVIDRGIASGELRNVDAEFTVKNIIGPLFMHVVAAGIFGVGDSSGAGLQTFMANHLDVLFNGISKEK